MVWVYEVGDKTEQNGYKVRKVRYINGQGKAKSVDCALNKDGNVRSKRFGGKVYDSIEDAKAASARHRSQKRAEYAKAHPDKIAARKAKAKEYRSKLTPEQKAARKAKAAAYRKAHPMRVARLAVPPKLQHKVDALREAAKNK
jgi:hypothetical protein